jgi:hypothetical protein
MTDLEKAARMALEAMEYYQIAGLATTRVVDSITALRQALSDSVEQPAQQESVGYVYSVHGERIKNACIKSDVPNGTPLYTSPQSKPWVGLTDEEKAELDAEHGDDTLAHLDAIEAKLKEKNA